MRAPSEIVREHWPEYLMEAVGLGLFMISAAFVTALLEYPHSPFYQLLPDPVVRRALIGITMGLTAIGIIYSPWGKRSGAHLNPAITVTFFRLGKIQGLDALFYVLAQFVGGPIGLLVAARVIGMAIEHPTVNYVVTVPGFDGTWIAFVAEACISFGLMLIVLIVSNQTKLNAWTGVFAGALVATYITVEAPASGMSMNPARSFASALPAHLWTVVASRDRPINLEYSASVAENPTITIVPITGEEFTKRVLRSLDEDKFEFLVRQGYDINMVLRLMARGIAIDDERGSTILFNAPSQGEGYQEFRRRLLHLAGLDAERKLFVGPILFEESQTVRTNRPPNQDEVVAALEKGFRWEGDGEGKVHTVHRKAVGRILIANYDPSRLSNEERRQLHEEAQRVPSDSILVDLRPGHPGGEYPLHGSILLRSMNSIIGFVAKSIEEELEMMVSPDPRTKTVVRNPARTLEIEESDSKPDDYEFSVLFDGRHYSVRKYPVSQGMVPSWNQEAFAVLSNLFQMTVTDLTKYPTPAIAIAK